MEKFKELPFITKLHVVFLFISFIDSMYPWYIWNNQINLVVTAVTAFFALLNFRYYNLSQKTTPVFLFTCLFFMFFWGYHNCKPVGYLLNMLPLINLTVLILYDDCIKKIALNFMTNGMAVIIAISLFCYILFLLGFYPVTPTSISFKGGFQYESMNYYTFIVPLKINFDSYIRFHSIFAEPGHFAMGSVLLMAANKFQFSKKSIIILLLGNIFSISLAAYITITIGVILYNISLKKIYKIVLFILFAFVAIYAVENSGYGKILDTYLWRRIYVSEDGGFEIKNNRYTYYYNEEFKKVVSNPMSLLIGGDEPIVDYSGGNAGYKVFVVENGILGLMLVVAFYSMSCVINRKRDNFIFTLILLLLLFQDFYPFWSCVLFTYILSQKFVNGTCQQITGVSGVVRKNGESFIPPSGLN